MRLRSELIVVKDIEKAKKNYSAVFGLERILDDDGNLFEVGSSM